MINAVYNFFVDFVTLSHLNFSIIILDCDVNKKFWKKKKKKIVTSKTAY